MPRVPTGTNPRDCTRVGEGKDWTRESGGSGDANSHLLLTHRQLQPNPPLFKCATYHYHSIENQPRSGVTAGRAAPWLQFGRPGRAAAEIPTHDLKIWWSCQDAQRISLPAGRRKIVSLFDEANHHRRNHRFPGRITGLQASQHFAGQDRQTGNFIIIDRRDEMVRPQMRK